MTTVATPMDEWRTIPWRTLERAVCKLQTRIYRATQRGNVPAVRRLQRLLVQSRAAKLLAVRRVTQDNRGKRTAGVDGVKALTPPQRLRLASTLSLPSKARPVRRVWIPKPGTEEQRPLGIPTMADRASQALLKLALEPEWEAKFEPNSYGFRPGRSAHDAIEAIHNALRWKAKYVLDADIAKCFDRISQEALLQKLNTTPTFRRALRAWLKAGVMEGTTLFPTEAGTPQGGVISPLLANVALHGLETRITAAFPEWSRYKPPRERWKPIVVRYADDFVVMHQEKAAIEQAQAIAADWLAGMGLELKPSKTRITHTLEVDQGTPGFDFLGFHVRQYPVGKTHSGRNRHGNQLGFKTIIKPSTEALKRHAKTMGDLVKAHKAAPQAALIRWLNPRIRGWAAYYRTVAASQAFHAMDHVLYWHLYRWARRRHRKQSRHWVVEKYWHPKQGTWAFTAPQGEALRRHRATRIHRHVKVQGARSPYDGDWRYWATRLGRHPELPPAVAWLLREQQGKCAACRLYFKSGDVLEVDHVVPTSRGGRNDNANRQLLHGHCHDRKTAADGSAAARRTDDHSRTAEEPCALKGACTVLETGGVR